MKRHHITDEDYAMAKELAKRNKDKNVDRRLRVPLLRYEGRKDVEIAEITGYHRKRVSQLCAEFCAVGPEEYARPKYGGNHRSMPEDEEKAILAGFEEKAKDGHVVTAWEIKSAFDEKLGRETGRGYIYMLLARHGWRKVMPRGKHPDKASDEAIEASKKLKLSTGG